MVSRTQKNVIALRDIEKDTKRNVPGGYAGLNEEGVLSLETIPEEIKNPEGSGPSTGDVVGPSVSVTNEVAVFDGVTGKLLKSSGIKYTDFVTSTTLTSTLSNYTTVAATTILTNTVNTKVSKSGDSVSGFYQSSVHNLGTSNGQNITPGLVTSNFKLLYNTGAFTLTAPADGNYTMIIAVLPDGTTGAMTTEGFSKVIGEFKAESANILVITVIGNKKWLTIMEG